MTFSVIVPTYNRVCSLERTLGSISRQEFRDFELIVVDDGSTDGTGVLLAKLAAEGSLVAVRQQNRGPASARNAGLREARGQYVAYTDDDCIVPPEWLRLFEETFRTSGADVVGGVVRNRITESIFAEVSQEIINHFVRELNAENSVHGFMTSNNIAYRTDALKAIGGFDERFRRAGGEERAANAAIVRNGGRSVLRTDSVVDHYHSMTARGFFRQHQNYGRGSYILYRVRGHAGTSSPPPIPPSAYLSLIIRWLKEQPGVALQKIALFVGAQAMVAIGFLREAFTNRKPESALAL